MREDVTYEQKYRYLLYRIQQALIEMDVEPKQHRGRGILKMVCMHVRGLFLTTR